MSNSLLEIRFHGRGGQGAKTAAQILAETALLQGKNIQAFPEYGPERMGAPVRCFVRISDNPITTYAPVTNPDMVIVIDETLLSTVNVAEGLDNDGILVINSSKNPETIREEIGSFKGKIVTVDGTRLSLKYLNKNIPNIALLAGFVKATGIVKFSELQKIIKDHFFVKLGKDKTEANMKMSEEAYKTT